MTPLSLSLKNFMCYGEDTPPLDFDAIHVACLCGDNGHGKTAILDAVCWALWGIARASIARSGAVSAPNLGQLVRIGQSHMSVQLDFAAQNQRYRVIRAHSVPARGASGKTTLELQTHVPGSDDEFRSISGPTVPDTNRRIRQILNMDFKTFLNTAYLAQGQADAFTASAPAERKNCLALTLDLHYYQRLADAANRRARAAQTDIDRADAAIDALAQDAAQKPDAQRRLADARARIAETQPQLDDARQRTQTLRQRTQALQAAQSEADAVQQRRRQAQAEARTLRPQIQADEQRLADCDRAIADAPRVQDGFAQLQRAQTEAARLDDALSRKSRLDADRAAAAQSVARAEERAKAEIQSVQRRIQTELQPKADRIPSINEAIAALEPRRAELKARIEKIKTQRAQMDAAAAQQSALEQQNRSLRDHMQDTRKKYDMLQSADHDGDRARAHAHAQECPLCSQRLTPDGKRNLLAEYERLGVESRNQYRRNETQIATLKSEHARINRELRELEEANADTGRSLAAQEATLIRDREDAIAAASAVQTETAALADLNRRLRSDEFAAEERSRLSELDAAISALDYDADAHRRTRAAVQSLLPFADRRRELDAAQANRPAVAEAVQTNSRLLQSRETEIAAADQRIAALQSDLRNLPAQQDALGEAAALADRLAADIQALQVQEAVLLNDIARAEETERRIAAARQERKALAEQRGVFAQLTSAFGKDGIQALIIETAIPQLQDDANAILARITQNRMHLRLELDEGASERLEIRIADELGTRDYQTFSGGEAFRINFALRIALSKLLARRAGAPLPVLFIDEGFGSQDRAGQELIAEAIQSIQDDFEKIIVITHIDEIKQAFPVRIEVAKRENGSTFKIA